MALAEKTIIEFGCGFGTWGHIIRSRVDQGGDKAYMVGCDIYRHYLQNLRTYNPYDDLVRCDARYLPFKKDCAHFVFAFEITEHLNKRDGQKFLTDLPTLASEVVVSMPYGYFEQEEIRGNRNEKHLASWERQDLVALGYTAEKTGLAMDIENTTKKYHLYDLYHLARKKHRCDWAGAMLIGTYVKTGNEQCRAPRKKP